MKSNTKNVGSFQRKQLCLYFINIIKMQKKYVKPSILLIKLN